MNLDFSIDPGFETEGQGGRILSSVQYVQYHSKERWDAGWRPIRNPTQQLAADSEAIYILLHGEKGSGKTVCGLDMLVEHCFLNSTEGLIVVQEVGQAIIQGAWGKLMAEILPKWKRGNRNQEGEPIDAGVGITYGSEGYNECFKYDQQTKKPCVWMSTYDSTAEHPKWSMIHLTSLPIPNKSERKSKGKEPTFVFVDEADLFTSPDYFRLIIQQLGRRRGVKARSKMVLSCNPSGPSHWLYDHFFIRPLNQKTGEWDKRFAQIHMPFAENAHNLPPRYIEDYVAVGVSGDPIAEARLLRGEWMDKCLGTALFANSFVEDLHMLGDAAKGQGFQPVAEFPIIFSYDLGDANTVIVLEQIINDARGQQKLVFDTIDHVNNYVPYDRLVVEIHDKMLYWEEKVGAEFEFIHVPGDDTFSQFRAPTGSFDNFDIERLSVAEVEQRGLPHRYVITMRRNPFKMTQNSVAARVRMIRDALIKNEILISATCTNIKKMFLRLEEDDEKPLHPKKNAEGQIHRFDALSYGFFYFDKRTRVVRPLPMKQESQFFLIR